MGVRGSYWEAGGGRWGVTWCVGLSQSLNLSKHAVFLSLPGISLLFED